MSGAREPIVLCGPPRRGGQIAQGGVTDRRRLPIISSWSGAEIGDPDVEMRVAGEGFTETCVITFNGGDEPTTFVSETEVSTMVKPSTATTSGTYPITVKRGAEESAPLGFTFVDPARTRAEPDRGAVRSHARGGGKT